MKLTPHARNEIISTIAFLIIISAIVFVAIKFKM